MPMTRPTTVDTRTHDLARFYRALGRLETAVGGKRKLSDCDGRMQWPSRGVYFFFETGESRANSGSSPRVVRVGTHAVSSGSRTTLWKRLSQHRGTASTVGGNHRGSVLRLLVGAALLRRDPVGGVKTWGGPRPDTENARVLEKELERRVSRVIRAMPLQWLWIDDPARSQSRRAYIERNAIALLSNWDREALDSPSDGWLGLDCPRDMVARSGLWNQRHVRDTHDQLFLPAFERLVEEHITNVGRG